jgi:FMN phosphatase YigB (HAD superfamily)
MAKTLQEYADWLSEREDLRWPKPPALEIPKATAYLKPLSGIRAVAWNIYGTLLRIADGELLFEVPQELRMQIALEKVDAEFNMWNHMYRKPVAPWKYLHEQYRKILEKQRLAATKVKGDVPEVISSQVWRQIVARLEEKEYEYDADFYGDLDELSEKIAYFFHTSLQGLEASPHALRALQIVANGHVPQGLLADAQSFTLVQLLRCLSDQGKLPPLGDLFQFRLMVLSYQVGVRKPSKTLFQTFLQRAGDSGVSPNEILYISSRLDQDLAIAKESGMHTALYAGDKLSLRATKEEIGNPKLRPDRLLTDLAQIGELLGL